MQEHAKRVFDHKQTIKRACSRLFEDKYNLLINDCEHFVSWCICGKASIQQVNKVVISVVAKYLLGSGIGSAVTSAAFRVLRGM